MAAAKQKMAMKQMGAAPKLHGWEGKSGKGKPPFVGAAPPIHTVGGGKYIKKAKKK